tara:strand:- start:134 stop:355 length:222 start_codon:yes stop_codon:yes gene_type:complete
MKRLAVFAKAAQLLSQSEHRGWVLGATVLQQGMNYQQAQLDSICKYVVSSPTRFQIFLRGFDEVDPKRTMEGI